jgi:hypothetical protein
MGLEKQLFLYDIESELVEVYLLPTELGYKETKQYSKKDSLPCMEGCIIYKRFLSENILEVSNYSLTSNKSLSVLLFKA